MRTIRRHVKGQACTNNISLVSLVVASLNHESSRSSISCFNGSVSSVFNEINQKNGGLLSTKRDLRAGARILSELAPCHDRCTVELAKAFVYCEFASNRLTYFSTRDKENGGTMNKRTTMHMCECICVEGACDKVRRVRGLHDQTSLTLVQKE